MEKNIKKDLNLVLKENEGLVYYALKGYKHRNDFEDIMQEGRIALLIAYKHFDPNKMGFNNWGPYAFRCIRQRINGKVIKYNSRKKRNFGVIYSLNSKFTMNKNNLDTDYTNNDNESIVNIVDRKIDIENEIIDKVDFENALKLLDPYLRKILILRSKGYTLREVGEIMGITGEWVRQKLLVIKTKLQGKYL